MDISILRIKSALAGVFILLFCYLLARIKSFKTRARKLNTPPEAGGAWPIIGHLPLLRGPEPLPHITLAAMADKYGPIFTIRLGLHRSIVVSSWELARELFTTHDVAVSSRPKMLAAKHLGYDYAMFGFAPYGPYWREMRKIVSLELLSSRRLDLLKHVRVSETDTSIRELHKLWADKRDESGRVMVEMRQWFSDLTLNVIMRIIAGKRYFGTETTGDDEDKAEARRCQRIFRKFFYLTGMNVVGDVIPWLGWLDLGGHEKAMKMTAKELDDLLVGWLEEHHRRRRGHGGGGKAKGDQDFMDVMIAMLADAEIHGYDADTVNKATCMAVIIGATDTTALMLTWTLCLLMNNPNALEKAKVELDVHVGKGRQVDESDIANLTYLQAIVKEALRLYPPVPLGGPRELSQDCNIGGYHVPKGTRLILHLWKLQRDPLVWAPESTEFRPERFLTAHKDVDVYGQNFELLPFGAGRRVCPGTNFGMQMLHLVLASLLHAFELSTPNNESVDMTESAGLTTSKATPLEVLIAPQLSPNLYE